MTVGQLAAKLNELREQGVPDTARVQLQQTAYGKIGSTLHTAVVESDLFQREQILVLRPIPK